MKVKLIYPAYVITKPPRAIAIAEARETKTQYVIRGEDIEFIENSGNIRFRNGVTRFWKKNGRKVGQAGYTHSTWYCTGPMQQNSEVARSG